MEAMMERERSAAITPLRVEINLPNTGNHLKRIFRFFKNGKPKPAVRTTKRFYFELKTLVPSDDAIVDLVFIPGRSGENDSTYWPTDFLKKDIPPARILAFEYRREFLHLFEDAELFNLASEFAKQCNASLPADRPKIFVAYKFGALILQIALTKNVTLFSKVLGLILISNPLGSEVYESSVMNPSSEIQRPEGYISHRTLPSPDSVASEPQSKYQFTSQEFRKAHETAQISVVNLPSSPSQHDSAQVRFDNREAVEYKLILREFHTWLTKQQQAELKDWKDISMLAWDTYTVCNASSDVNIADCAPSIAELANNLHVVEEGARAYGLGSSDLKDLQSFYKKLKEWFNRLLKEPEYKHVSQVADLNTELGTINHKLHKGVKFNLTEPKPLVRQDQAENDGINRDNDVKFNLPLVSYPLSDDDEARKIWKEIQEGVEEVLTKSKIAWSMIDICYRRRPGYDYTKTTVKYKPVVLIIANRTSEQESGKLKATLQNKIKMIISSLNMTDIELGVELVNGRVRLQGPPIGTGLIECGNVFGGTLGGWVQLCPIETKDGRTKPGNPLQGRYILTNHHVVRPPDNNHPGPFNDFTLPQTLSASGESGFTFSTTSMSSEDNGSKNSLIKDGNELDQAPSANTVTEDPGIAADSIEWIPPIRQDDGVLINLLSPFQNSTDRFLCNDMEKTAITQKYTGQPRTRRINFTLDAYESGRLSNTWDDSRYDPHLGAYGKVVASSGWRLRSSGPSTGLFMDWALIRVDVDDSRPYENRIPEPSPAAAYEMPLKILHHATHPQPKHMIRLGRADRNRQQLVARVGMRTTSYGVLDNRQERVFRFVSQDVASQRKAARMYGWLVYGYGLNYFPNWNPISLRGDSGSWIINSEGDLVALLYAGDGESSACVTPIEDVIRDIEEKTSCTIRLPGGVDPLLYNDLSLPAAYRGPL